AVYWPAMLMAAGEAPPKCVFAYGWLMVGGEKMSKTRLNQIAPGGLVTTFGSDGVRYHFLRDQNFGPDGDYSYEAMVASYNADLGPWALPKAGDSAAVAAALGDCLETLRIVTLLASPLIPDAAGELWRRLGLPGSPEDQRLPGAAAWGGMPAGLPLERGPA